MGRELNRPEVSVGRCAAGDEEQTEFCPGDQECPRAAEMQRETGQVARRPPAGGTPCGFPTAAALTGMCGPGEGVG